MPSHNCVTSVTCTPRQTRYTYWRPVMRLCLPLAVLTFLPAASTTQIPLSSLHPLPVVQSTTLIDALSADKNYTRLIRLLQRARLVPTLNRLNGSTLFAPTNDAIQQHKLWSAASASDESYASLADNIQEKLRQQLFYHLLNYSVTSLPSQQQPEVLKTLHFPHIPVDPPSKEPPPNPPWLPVPGGSLGGEPQRLRWAARDSATWVGTDHAGNGGIQLVRPIVDAGNGVLLGIGGVLEPPKDLGKSSGLGLWSLTYRVVAQYTSCRGTHRCPTSTASSLRRSRRCSRIPRRQRSSSPRTLLGVHSTLWKGSISRATFQMMTFRGSSTCIPW